MRFFFTPLSNFITAKQISIRNVCPWRHRGDPFCSLPFLFIFFFAASSVELPEGFPPPPSFFLKSGIKVFGTRKMGFGRETTRPTFKTMWRRCHRARTIFVMTGPIGLSSCQTLGFRRDGRYLMHRLSIADRQTRRTSTNPSSPFVDWKSITFRAERSFQDVESRACFVDEHSRQNFFLFAGKIWVRSRRRSVIAD